MFDRLKTHFAGEDAGGAGRHNESEKMDEKQEPTDETTAQGDTNLSPAMQIRDRIITVLRTVYDPEIPVDIYELGLIYGVDVTDDGEAHLTMTLTTPMCPVAETLPPEVEDKVRDGAW